MATPEVGSRGPRARDRPASASPKCGDITGLPVMRTWDPGLRGPFLPWDTSPGGLCPCPTLGSGWTHLGPKTPGVSEAQGSSHFPWAG